MATLASGFGLQLLGKSTVCLIRKVKVDTQQHSQVPELKNRERIHAKRTLLINTLIAKSHRTQHDAIPIHIRWNKKTTRVNTRHVTRVRTATSVTC